MVERDNSPEEFARLAKEAGMVREEVAPRLEDGELPHDASTAEMLYAVRYQALKERQNRETGRREYWQGIIVFLAIIGAATLLCGK